MQNEKTYTLDSRWSSLTALINAHASGSCIKLDLGCGYYKPPGYIGLDNLEGAAAQLENQSNPPDIYMNLNRDPLPFKSNSVTEVRSSHFLEHSNLPHILEESYRVLKPGGKFLLIVPYANSAEGMYPGHHIFLTEKWFYENIGFQRRFKIVRERFDMSNDYRRSPLRLILPFSLARKHLFNVCHQMTLECRTKP